MGVIRQLFEIMDPWSDEGNGKADMYFSDNVPSSIQKQMSRFGADPEIWSPL